MIFSKFLEKMHPLRGGSLPPSRWSLSSAALSPSLLISPPLALDSLASDARSLELPPDLLGRRGRQVSSSFVVYGSVAIAQCVLCKVRCHCIFSGPGIRYSDIFCVPCISSGYSDIFWHISVVDTVAYFGGNHGSRVWKSLKLKKVYFPRTRTSWDKYMFNRIVFFKF